MGSTLTCKGGILLRFLSDYLENLEHHPLVIRCDTLTPKDVRLSNIIETTNPFIARPLCKKTVHRNEMRLFIIGQGIPQESNHLSRV